MGSAPMSNSIGTTIRELRKQRGLSVPKLAALLSLSQSYLYDLEHDRRVPSVPILQRLAEFFHVTADELMTSSTPENKNAPAETKPGEGAKTRRIISMEDWIKVPIVSRECTACCGSGITAADITNWDEGFILINPDSLRRFDDRRMPYAVHCEGDCMESVGIKDGDLAIINPAEEPMQGTVALVSIAGSLSLKRFYTTPGGDVILRSDLGQTRYTPEMLERDEFMVCGVLVGTYQGRPKALPL